MAFWPAKRKLFFFYKSRVRKKVLNSQKKECIPFTWQTYKDYLMKSHKLRAGKGTRGDFMAYKSSEGRHYSRSWYVTRPIGGWHWSKRCSFGMWQRRVFSPFLRSIACCVSRKRRRSVMDEKLPGRSLREVQVQFRYWNTKQRVITESEPGATEAKRSQRWA